jgi:hypothetical protein
MQRCSIQHHNSSDYCDWQDTCEQDKPKQRVFEDIEAVVHSVTSSPRGLSREKRFSLLGKQKSPASGHAGGTEVSGDSDPCGTDRPQEG